MPVYFLPPFRYIQSHTTTTAVVMRCLFLCLPRTLETPSLPRHFVHGHSHTERRGAEIAGIFPLSRDTRKSHSFTPLEIERGERTPLPPTDQPKPIPPSFPGLSLLSVLPGLLSANTATHRCHCRGWLGLCTIVFLPGGPQPELLLLRRYTMRT